MWHVPQTSELAMVSSCAGSRPSAACIGAVFGSAKGPISRSAGPTGKLPVKVRAKPVASGLRSCWRSSTQALRSGGATASVPSAIWWQLMHEMPSRARAP